MAKTSKAKHLQARVTFLEQAAKLLAEQQFTKQAESAPSLQNDASLQSLISNTGLPLMLASHLHTVSKRTQVRVGAAAKRSFCKVCSTPLLEDKTCLTKIENASKNGKRHLADIETVTCLNCGTKKRFPIGAHRQLKKAKRADLNSKIRGSR